MLIEHARRALQQPPPAQERTATAIETEHEIEPGTQPVRALDRLQLRQIEGRELRKDLAHLLPGAAVGGRVCNDPPPSTMPTYTFDPDLYPTLTYFGRPPGHGEPLATAVSSANSCASRRPQARGMKTLRR